MQLKMVDAKGIHPSPLAGEGRGRGDLSLTAAITVTKIPSKLLMISLFQNRITLKP